MTMSPANHPPCDHAPVFFQARVAASLFVLFGGACVRSPDGDATAPAIPERLRLEITGGKYAWQVRYPGTDGDLGTGDDFLTRQDVHVASGVNTHIELQSRDFIYTFALPHLDIKEIAVPDLSFSIDFVPGAVGEYPLLGDQMCGYAHPELMGTLHVLSPDDFIRWMAERGRGVE